MMNTAATTVFNRGVGPYTIRLLKPAATPWATTAQGTHSHVYQPTTPCRLP